VQGKAKAKSKVQIDPKLSQALQSAGDEGTVEAVLMFENPKSASGAQRSDRIKRQIAKISSGEPVETNYFPNLGSVSVRAKGRVVKKLLKQPGLAVAALNRL
jgi:hypothetical protein